MKIRLLALCAFFWLFHIVGFSQGMATSSHPVTIVMPALAILDIEPINNSIELSLNQPFEAGLPISTGSNSMNTNLWLNYSSAVATASPDRRISVYIDSGTLPGGVALKLQAGTYTGSGAGTHGTASGQIVLSTISQTIVSGIRGAYTGDGVGNGHQLTYSLDIADYAEIYAVEAESLIITFTITDN